MVKSYHVYPVYWKYKLILIGSGGQAQPSSYNGLLKKKGKKIENNQNHITDNNK